MAILYSREISKTYVSDIRLWPSETTSRVMITKVPKRLKLAHDVIRNIGYPSMEVAEDLLFNGANVVGMPVNRNDLRESIQVLGPHVGYVRGRKKWRDATVRVDTIIPVQKERQELFCDIMHINKLKFLISVAKPLDLSMVTRLPDKYDKEAIGRVLQEHINSIAAYGFPVRTIHADGEFAPQEGKLPGVVLDICGAGDHVGVAENKIQQLKATIRSIHGGLSFNLPDLLTPHLVDYATFRQNIFPTGITKIAPKVALTGTKLRYKQELSIGFGDYCEVSKPIKPSMKSHIDEHRTEPALALSPCGNTRGSWTFLNLNTGKIIRRSIWTRMEMNQLVLDRILELTKTVAMLDIENDENEHDSDGVHDQEYPTYHDRQPSPVRVEITGLDQISANTLDAEYGSAEKNDALDWVGHAGDTNNDEDEHDSDETHGKTQINLTIRQAKKQNIDIDAALEQELKAMFFKEVFHPVKRSDIPQGCAIIPSHMIITEKFHPDGSFNKVKARLVAGGNLQDPSTIYTNTASPTAKIPMIFALIAKKGFDGYDFCTADITQAYLNAPIDGDIYMYLDVEITKKLMEIFPFSNSYIDDKERIVVKLDKALYGLQQSATLWNRTLSKAILDMGYNQCADDPCIFYNKNGEIIIIYVDDLLLMHHTQQRNKEVLQELSKHFEIEATSDYKQKVYNYLGMKVEKHDDYISITMKGFIESLLNDYGSVRLYKSPATEHLFQTDVDENIKQEEVTEAEQKRFHTFTAKLLYLSQRIRPDISLAVSYLTTRVTNPTQRDIMKLERVIGYIQQTQNYDLRFNRHVHDSTETDRLTAYVDASFCVHPDGKSQSGLVVRYCGATIATKSTKQSMVSKSSTESELIALSDYYTWIMELHDCLNEMGIVTDTPMLLQDNESVIKLITSGNFSHRTRHLKARTMYIADAVKENKIVLKKIHTSWMLSDVLNKVLQGRLFLFTVRLVLGHVDEEMNDQQLIDLRERVDITTMRRM